MTWILDSNKSKKFPSNATGKAYEHRFSNGIVFVEQQYWKNYFIRHLGFKDITPIGTKRSVHQDPKTALFIHHGGVGDVLFMTPAIKWFHKQYPNCMITVSSSARGADVFMNNTDLTLLNIEETKQVYHNISTDEYDMVFCFDGEITLNPFAQLYNVYDIFLDCVGAPINEMSDEEKNPTLYVTDKEMKVFKKNLKKIYKIDMNKEKFVVLQYETSSMLRNLEIPKMIQLAREIVEKYGYYVIMIGDKSIYKYYQEKKCSSCGKIVDLNVGPRIHYTIVRCEECGNKIGFDSKVFDDIDKKIIFPDQLILREIILFIKNCEFVVGLDSCCVHIAGAFDKPCLGLYGPFDGDLRMRYYKYGRWIQKTDKCGPCMLHGHSCLDTGGIPNYPHCMKQFKIDEIMKEIQKTIDLVPMDSTPFVELKDIEDETYTGYREYCPVCGDTECEFVMRRSYIKFLRCKNCEAIYTDIIVDGSKYYDDKSYTGCYLTKNYRKRESELAVELNNRFNKHYGNIGRFLDVGCGAGTIVDKMEKLGWISDGLETGDNYKLTYDKLEINVYDKTVENFDNKYKYDLILMNHVIEHIHDPIKLFEKLEELLTENGVISIITPDTDKWNERNNNWIYLNASFVGEHTIVYNKSSLEHLANVFGYEIIYCKPVIKHHSGDQLWIDIRRKK